MPFLLYKGRTGPPDSSSPRWNWDQLWAGPTSQFLGPLEMGVGPRQLQVTEILSPEFPGRG